MSSLVRRDVVSSHLSHCDSVLRDWVDALAAGSVCQGSLASALASRVSAPCIRQLADLGWNFMSAFAVQVMDRELAQAISAIIGAAKLAANLLHNEPTLEEYLSRASVRKLEEIRKFPKASPGRTVGDFLGSPTNSTVLTTAVEFIIMACVNHDFVPCGPLVKDSGDHLAELKIPLERTEAVDTCLSEFALHHVQAAVYFTAAMQFAESAPSGPEPAIVMEHRAKVFRMLAETDFGEGTPDHRRRDATLEHDFVASLGDSVFCRAFIHDKRLSQAYAMAYMAVEKHDGSELFQLAMHEEHVPLIGSELISQFLAPSDLVTLSIMQRCVQLRNLRGIMFDGAVVAEAMRWSLCYGKDVFDPKGLYTPPGRGLWPRLYAKFWKLPRDAPEVAFWRAYIFQRDVTMGCSRMMLEIEQIRLDLFKSIAMAQEGCLGSGGSVSLTEALSMWGDINVGLGPIASQALSFRDELDGDDKAAVHDFELFWLAVAEVAYEMGLRWHAVNMHCLNPINPWKLQVSGELLGLLADPVQHVVWVGDGPCLARDMTLEARLIAKLAIYLVLHPPPFVVGVRPGEPLWGENLRPLTKDEPPKPDITTVPWPTDSNAKAWLFYFGAIGPNGHEPRHGEKTLCVYTSFLLRTLACQPRPLPPVLGAPSRAPLTPWEADATRYMWSRIEDTDALANMTVDTIRDSTKLIEETVIEANPINSRCRPGLDFFLTCRAYVPWTRLRFLPFDDDRFLTAYFELMHYVSGGLEGFFRSKWAFITAACQARNAELASPEPLLSDLLTRHAVSVAFPAVFILCQSAVVAPVLLACADYLVHPKNKDVFGPGPPEFERIFSTALVSPVLPYLESLMPSILQPGPVRDALKSNPTRKKDAAKSYVRLTVIVTAILTQCVTNLPISIPCSRMLGVRGERAIEGTYRLMQFLETRVRLCSDTVDRAPLTVINPDDLVSVLRKSGLDRTDLKKQHFKQNITRPPVTRVGQEGAAGKAEVDMLDHFVMAVVNVMSAIREGITKPIPARKGAARREAAPQPVPVEVTAEAEDSAPWLCWARRMMEQLLLEESGQSEPPAAQKPSQGGGGKKRGKKAKHEARRAEGRAGPSGAGRTAVAAALDAAGELELRREQARAAPDGSTVDAGWWEGLVQAARVELSVRVGGRPTDPLTWEVSVNAVDPGAAQAFRAVRALIKELVEPCIGDGVHLPTPCCPALLAALSRGLGGSSGSSAGAKGTEAVAGWLRVIGVAMLSVKELYTMAIVVAFLRGARVPLSEEALLAPDRESDAAAVKWRAELLASVKAAWTGANGRTPGAPTATAVEMALVEDTLRATEKSMHGSAGVGESSQGDAGTRGAGASEGPKPGNASNTASKESKQGKDGKQVKEGGAGRKKGVGAVATASQGGEPPRQQQAQAAPTPAPAAPPAPLPSAPAPAVAPGPRPPAPLPVAPVPAVAPEPSPSAPRPDGGSDTVAALEEAVRLLSAGAQADVKALSRAKRRVGTAITRAAAVGEGPEVVAALRAAQSRLTAAISEAQLRNIAGSTVMHAHPPATPSAPAPALGPLPPPPATARAPPPPASHQPVSVEDEHEDDDICTICYERERSVTFLPCGHHISCLECATAWRRKAGTCPKCSAKIERMTDVEEGFVD